MNDRRCIVGQRKAMMQVMEPVNRKSLFKDIHGQPREIDALVAAWRLASIHRMRGRKNRPLDRRSGFIRLAAALNKRRSHSYGLWMSVAQTEPDPSF